jgi:protease I
MYQAKTDYIRFWRSKQDFLELEVTMEIDLTGFKVAVLLADRDSVEAIGNFQAALSKTGATVVLVGRQAEDADAKQKTADKVVEFAAADETAFDALVLPSGSERLARDRRAVEFARKFLAADKPVVAVGAAPLLLAETGELSGRRITSSATHREALQKSGAEWIEEDVVVDGTLLTGGSDSQHLIETMLKELLDTKDKTGSSLHTD